MSAAKVMRPWSDEEIGLIASYEHLSHQAMAAMLGRSIYSVKNVRLKVARGWTKGRFPWTADEDSVILSANGLTTNAQLATRLPGRSVRAVEKRRWDMGLTAPTGVQSSPYVIANRTLIAKTCTRCGHLMPGEKFRTSPHRHASHCNYCRGDESRKWSAQNPEKKSKSAAQIAASKRWQHRVDALTKDMASRSGYPYLDADFEVLADPTISIIGKALRLGRTYAAVLKATSSHGFESLSNRLGQRLESAWSIDNPNADRVDEITAELKQEFESAGVKFPEWDWDDEDLKESA